MNKSDFIFNRKDNTDNKYIDYWFDIKGETQQELTDKFMEQSMIAVSGCVYSLTDKQIGIKRIFPWNYDVILVEDEQLSNILEELIFELEK